MTMRKFLLLSAKIVAGLLALAIAAVAACIMIGVTIDLSFLKPGVEASAQAALGRQVKIEGPVVFEFSTWPAIEVGDVSIANLPKASDPVFFRAGRARLQIALLPLLKRTVQIGEIAAEDVTLNLENDARGRPNWLFGAQKTEPPPKGTGDTSEAEKAGKTTAESSAEAGKKLIGFSGLNRLSLKKIRLTYRDAALGKSFKFELDEMAGQAAPGEPISLDFKGRLQKYDYAMALRGSTIEDLVAASKPWAFTLKGDVAGEKIGAKGDLMARGQHPEINLAFGIRDVDVGAILSALGLVEGMDASVGDAGFKVSINGGSLKQILEQSSLSFAVRNGRWKVSIPNTRARVDITDLSGAIQVQGDKALTMDLRGRIEQTPLKLRITGAPLARYVINPRELPLAIQAELANTRLDFSSKVALPVSSRNLELALKVSGNRLDDLDDLLRMDLPPIGPILLDTRLKITKTGYDLSILRIGVGKSRLTGRMKLDTTRQKPRLDVKLVSDLIRIDDFVARKPEGARQKPAAAKTPPAEKKAKEPKAAAANRRNPLSHEVLSQLDADISVEARQVTSGKDKLGDALMKLTLKDSRLAVEPLRVNVPGGGVQVDFDYLPTPTDVTVNVKADIDKFDLGIMFRRAKPGTDMGGIFSLDAKLHSTAPDLKHVMEDSGGHFNFMLVPKNFSSGIIDLWAVNLLSAIMSKASEKDKSEINCLVVRLAMQDGLMKEKAIYMDTTKMRIAGKAAINFKTRKLDITLVPKAKKPEFFSLAVPIKVQGTFDDFGLGIGVGRLAGSVLSFITSPILVPIRRIFAKKVPADGRDACMTAWTGMDEKTEKAVKPAKP
jgi:uncharacterized protein involved in outer membrane biogenesis